jgi:hypothetical protein
MNPSIKATAKSLLRGLAWLFFAMGGLAFLFGGGVISAVTKTDRIAAEMEGVLLALLCAAVGVMAKAAEDRLEEGDGPTSLGETLRK